MEGSEHFFFYALEQHTGRKFIHGQPVCLGVYLMALLQDNAPDFVLDTIRRAGVDMRPAAMGVSWRDVEQVMAELPAFVRRAGLWYTVIDDRSVGADLVEQAQRAIEG